jgi:predicted ArsR family transcriptional regulator
LERERVTVQEAARRLGITESAVRKRVARKQLPYDEVVDGKRKRLYVYLDRDQDNVPEPFRDRYLTSLEDRVRTLEGEVYRQQAIILNMTEAMKTLNPPAQAEPVEARESPASPGPTQTPTPAPGAPQAATQRPQGGTLRGLRRRILGW